MAHQVCEEMMSDKSGDIKSRPHPPLDLEQPGQKQSVFYREPKHPIRLLSMNEDGSYTLETFKNLYHCPRYVALSYTWGSPEEPREVLLNGYSFSIRRNLFEALNAIRYHIEKSRKRIRASQNIAQRELDRLARSAEPACLQRAVGACRYFWIDAICIDQENAEERNHQVRHMKDIFRRAQVVLAWLGPISDPALKYLADESHALSTIGVLELFGAAEYWNRMWTVQEFVFAQNVGFLSSDLTLPLRHIEKIYMELPESSHTQAAGAERDVLKMQLYKVPAMQERAGRRGWIPWPHTLPSVVKRFSHLECEDPRDTVYALLGLVDWKPSLGNWALFGWVLWMHSGVNPLLPDYTWSPSMLLSEIEKYGVRPMHLSPRLWDAALQAGYSNHVGADWSAATQQTQERATKARKRIIVVIWVVAATILTFGVGLPVALRVASIVRDKQRRKISGI